MQFIPIVISRLTNNGTKEIFTLKDPIFTESAMKNSLSPTNQFFTLDNCHDVERQKQSKMRIRRIQSSGSKRKFPKDFFSRQSHRPNKNGVSKQNQPGAQLSPQLRFQEVTNTNKQAIEPTTFQTPKFKQKYQTSRSILQTQNKNQTLRETYTRFTSLKQRQNAKLKKSVAPITCFQNTFSGSQFKKLAWKVENTIQSNGKENVETKKMKVNKEYLVKKIIQFQNRPFIFKKKILKRLQSEPETK